MLKHLRLLYQLLSILKPKGQNEHRRWVAGTSVFNKDWKRVIAGRPTLKLSELTKLILKLSFDLENIITAVIHISKKCAKMQCFLCENRKNPFG